MASNARVYSSVCNSPLTTCVSYAHSSTASASKRAMSRKNAGYCARATSSFSALSTPPASSTSSARSMNLGGGIRRPCSKDATDCPA